MSKVSVIGTITCRDGKAGEMEKVLTAMVEAARGETGVEIYSYHRGEGNTFWFFALMADEESTSVAELEEFIDKPVKFQIETLYTQEQFDVVLL